MCVNVQLTELGNYKKAFGISTIFWWANVFPTLHQQLLSVKDKNSALGMKWVSTVYSLTDVNHTMYMELAANFHQFIIYVKKCMFFQYTCDETHCLNVCEKT